MVLSLSFRRISIVYEYNSLGSPGKILSLQVHRLEKQVYILIVYSSIGSNGPFPLPKYCALPIASLDLIVCIYCSNDLFRLKNKWGDVEVNLPT